MCCNRLPIDGEIANDRTGGVEISERVRELWEPTYNAAPGKTVPMLVENRHGRREIILMQWGLRRHWMNAGQTRPSNARCETIFEKPTFRGLPETRRGIMPVPGYYEWKNGKPYYIRVPTDDVAGIGAIYDAWIDRRGQFVATFALITTTPAPSIEHIHNRMPVLIRHDDLATWISRDMRDANVVSSMMRPYDGDGLDYWEVSRRVNNVRNDGPDLIEPVSHRPAGPIQAVLI